MAESLKVNRAHMAVLLCLPAAVLIGYLLADPYPIRLSNMALVGLIFMIICSPLLMRYYHPLLIFSCNTIFIFEFLPGAPALWMLAALLGFFFAVINRCVDWQRRLMVGGNIPRSLLVLSAIVFITAYFRGGAGVAALGGSSYGGKRYFYIMMAVMAYFALVSQNVPPRRRKFYAILFFISGATSLMSFLVDFGGSKFNFLTFMVQGNFGEDASTKMSDVRLTGLGGICGAGLFCFLVWYGVRGILDKKWRLAMVGLFFAGTLLTGFRSTFGFSALVFVILFFLEGLHKTRYLFFSAVIGTVGLVILLLFSDRLPWQIQRSISFLPVAVNVEVKADAQSSLDWRFEMWRVVVQQVPQYFWEGKGYALDPGDMYMSQLNSYLQRGTDSSEWAVYAGDYHNGPLSLIIPFGIWGVIAFCWFLVAAGKMLIYNFLHGDPEIKLVNAIFLAYFIAKVFFFFILVGSFFSDLIFFTAITGLSISINGDRVRGVQKEVNPFFTLTTQRIAKDL